MCVFPKLKKLSISETFLNEKSKEILRNIYDGALEQPITINGKTIQPKCKPEPKKAIKFWHRPCEIDFREQSPKDTVEARVFSFNVLRW